MISKRELEYVSAWAKKVPYPGYDYCKETLERLKQCLIRYNEIYNGTQYNISFSNSEEITLEILPSNLAHMLGISHKEIMGEYKIHFRREALGMSETEKVTSYVLLSRIVDSLDTVLKYEDKYGNRTLNFYKLRVKCEIFEKLANLMNFNFGCINFNSDLYNGVNNRNINIKSEKILFTQSNEAVSPYFMIGIKPDEHISSEEKEIEETLETKYIIETLFAPSMPQNYFREQEVIIPTQILFDKNDILTKTSATPDQKRKIMAIYREVLSAYGLNSRLNIYGDYMALLSEQESFQKTIQRG